ncbi:MAG TPA: hypothetical protein VM734_16335 [Kofleriaceae bacterium]|jgi:hypothetical protein|nr:hypothetical protein [Kofleriaceae bacterium]
MRTTLGSLVVAGALGLSLVACVPQDDGPRGIAKALPRAEHVKINLPERSAAGQANAVGDIADWYVATRDVTRGLNGGTAYVLILVHTIVLFPPTSVDGDTYVWGPHHDALDPAEWRLTVTELADGTYDWKLDGHSLTTPTDPWETLVGGNAHGDGTGDFTLDFDAAERVNPIDNDGQGVIGVEYDVAARTLAMTIDTVADQGAGPVPVQFDYAYREASDGAGDMVFSVFADTADPGTLPEEATLRSRWLPTGAGRADLRLRNGDLQAEVTASECWSAQFRRVYYADSASWLPTEGAVGDCAFADQDLPEQ